MFKIFRQYRIKQKLDLDRVAQATNISIEKLVSFEQGKLDLSINELDQLVKFYGMEWDMLIEPSPKKRSSSIKKWIPYLIGILCLGAFFYLKNDIFTDLAMREESKSSASATEFSNKQPDVQDKQIPGEMTKETSGNNHFTLRFWGNMDYQDDSLPDLKRLEESKKMIEIFPVEFIQYQSSVPSWLMQRNPSEVILNGGTAKALTKTTEQEYERWKQLGYKTVGLNTYPAVYDPLIIQVEKVKVGFVSLSRVVHKIEDIATNTRIGLPKAYDPALVKKTVQQAKQQVDFLVVLVDWGKTWGNTPEFYQKTMADQIKQAGADLIVGNHPVSSQQMEFLDNVPVFYSLGYTSGLIQDGSFLNYVLEADISQQKRTIENMRIRVGKINQGSLKMKLSQADKKEVEKIRLQHSSKQNLIQFVY